MKTSNSIWIAPRILLLLAILSIFSGCSWFFDGYSKDYFYYVYVKNDSPYELELLLGSPELGSIFINPYDSSNYFGAFELDEGEDPQREGFFDGDYRGNNERIQVLINDTVVVDWIGPPREMDPDIHHFFNYNSWEEIIGERDFYRELRFTISPADFNSD